MDIFKNDEILDNMEDERLEEDLTQNVLMKSLGFNFSVDRNKMIKPYDSDMVRTKGMEPTSSHLKTMNPFDLIFNSQLLKSKLNYDKNPSEPNN